MDDVYDELVVVREQDDIDLPFNINDLPPEIRMKIDEIVRNNEDLEAQIDAIDALLFGSRQINDTDCESGIDVESTSSGSNAASVASSSEYVTVGGGTLDSYRSTVPTAVNPLFYQVDDVDDFVNCLKMPPPPEFFDSAAVSVVVIPPDVGFELPPPVEFCPSPSLPPLVELPEDDITVSDHLELRIPEPDYDVDDISQSNFELPPPPPDFVADFSDTTSVAIPDVSVTLSSVSLSTTPDVQSIVSNKNPPAVATKPQLHKQSAPAFSESLDVPTVTSSKIPSSVAEPAVDENGLSSTMLPLQQQYSVAKIVTSSDVMASELPVAVVKNAEVDRSNGPDMSTTVGLTVGSGDADSAAVTGKSPTMARRRFSGTTETQKLETVTVQKKKKNFLMKLLKRGSLSSGPTTENESSSKTSSSNVSSTLTSDTVGTFPAKSKRRAPLIMIGSSSQQKTSKTFGSSVDLPSGSATLPRSVKMFQSNDPPRTAAQASPKKTKVAAATNKKSAGPAVGRLHESHSTTTLSLTRSSSHDPPSSNSKGIAGDQLSQSARFERSLTELDDAVKADANKSHWSADEDDDSNVIMSSEDEDFDIDAVKLRIKNRKQLRDESGRLTIASPSINETLAKATSMMTLNQIGSRSATLPSSASVRSLTTDDIGFQSALGKKQDGRVARKYQKKNQYNVNIPTLTAGYSIGGQSPNRSPKQGRPAMVAGSMMNLSNTFGTDDDDVFVMKRSDYLPPSLPANASSSVKSKPSRTPSAATDRLLRRSMLSENFDPSILLVTDSISWLGNSLATDYNNPDLSIGQSNEDSQECKKFDTFRGKIKPMKWSEDGPDAIDPVVLRQSVVGRCGARNSFIGCGASLKRSRSSVPPEWVNVKPPGSDAVDVTVSKESVQLDKVAQSSVTAVVKPTIAPRPKSVPVAPVNRLESSVEQPQTVAPQTKDDQAESSHVASVALTPVTNNDELHHAEELPSFIPPPPEFEFGDDTADEVSFIPIPPADFAEVVENDVVSDEQQRYPPHQCRSMASELLIAKCYNHRPIHEAICDHSAIVDDFDTTKSLLLRSTSTDLTMPAGDFNDRERLTTTVRQFVADSKHFVAACTVAATNGIAADSTQSDAELRPVAEAAIHDLAIMSILCRRLTIASLNRRTDESSTAISLPVVGQLIEYASDVSSVFGDMLDTARLIVDSRSEAGRRFAVDNLNGHAVSLARILVAFVQLVRSM